MRRLLLVFALLVSAATVTAAQTWSSSPTSIATVNSAGVVTGVAVGSATITITYGGKSANHTFRIWGTTPPPPPDTTPHPPPPIDTTGGVIVYVTGDGVSGSSASAVASKIPSNATAVLMTGDNGYSSGTAANWASWNSTFGQFKTKTWWVPGNHEYGQSAAGPSYTYWCKNAPVHCMGDSGVYNWSFNVGGWHIIGLNSESGTSSGSTQDAWLKADLANNTQACVMALWHKPRWTSGSHSPATAMGPLYADLVAAHADLGFTGHNHNYERFAPMNAAGAIDSAGLRQFVVGTAGNGLYNMGTPATGSISRYVGWGVLKVVLHPTSYSWQFIPTSGSFTDTGSGTCHAK